MHDFFSSHDPMTFGPHSFCSKFTDVISIAGRQLPWIEIRTVKQGVIHDIDSSLQNWRTTHIHLLVKISAQGQQHSREALVGFPPYTNMQVDRHVSSVLQLGSKQAKENRAHMPYNWLMDQENVTFIQNEVLFSHKE
jgi:hypothetical protein